MKAPAIAQLAPVLEAGGDRLADLIARTETRLEEVARGHGDVLGRFAGETLGAGGKRLRPMLVYICAGDEASDTLVPAACHPVSRAAGRLMQPLSGAGGIGARQDSCVA